MIFDIKLSEMTINKAHRHQFMLLNPSEPLLAPKYSAIRTMTATRSSAAMTPTMIRPIKYRCSLVFEEESPEYLYCFAAVAAMADAADTSAPLTPIAPAPLKGRWD